MDLARAPRPAVWQLQVGAPQVRRSDVLLLPRSPYPENGLDGPGSISIPTLVAAVGLKVEPRGVLHCVITAALAVQRLMQHHMVDE